MNNYSISAKQLAELAAKYRIPPPATVQPIQELTISPPTLVEAETTNKYGELITYNEKQQEFINLVLSGKSCVLIGAAGTGKTTCQKGAISALIRANKLPFLPENDHKFLSAGIHGVIICAYTRRATNNIRANVSDDLKGNCLTVHKLLEYQPNFYEVEGTDSKLINKMVFEATRNRYNPLPNQIKAAVFEEGSMLSYELYMESEEALPEDCQYIFLGDIQQLPPVFGSAILGFKLLELPVIELTEVYRQALDSPIIKLAHRILSGRAIPPEEFPEWKYPGQLTIHPWQKKISADNAVRTLAKFFTAAMDRGMYSPETDAILIPFNKACGSTELNKYIADKLAKDQGKLVWEIVHGFNKSYYSVGDKCLYDREDAIIKNIYPNPQYGGVAPQNESTALNYWGHKAKSAEDEHLQNEDEKEDDIDFMLASVAVNAGKDEDRVNQCSHTIEIELLDSERIVKISTAGEVNNLILGYAITVHKSQGSEWEKVFLCLHQSHATMIQRELLYTAVTRARKELYVICEPETFVKGIESQRIKGDTLEEKAEYFKGKWEQMQYK